MPDSPREAPSTTHDDSGWPALMRFALKLLANLTDPRGDASDRLVNGLSRLAPNPE